MKNKLFLFVMALLLICNSAIAADTDTLTVRIKGMRCDDCAHKVMTAVTKDSGVEDIQFNLERRTATIIYNPQVTSSDSIYATLAATRRYKATPYSPDERIRRGFGFRMDDMVSQADADRIVENLKNIQGVDSVGPNLNKRYAFIRYDANRTKKAEIRATLNSLGYTPVNFYTSDKVAFAYYDIKGKIPSQDAIDEILTIDAVDDVNVNANKKTMAVTYFCEEITADQLNKAIRKAGIKVKR